MRGTGLMMRRFRGQADIMEQLKKFDIDAPGVQKHDERDMDKLNVVTIQQRVRAVKGKWLIFPKATEEAMRKGQRNGGS
jgi:hypothetical protein